MDDDKTYCDTVAQSISDIIRFSLNEEFRKSSCELFGVFSTKDAETEMSKRLMRILENERADSKEKRKKRRRNTGIVEEENNTFQEKISDESVVSTNCSCQTQNTSQPDWLQISSQQYRKAVKRKKLQFYSQPYEKDIEYSSDKVHCSNSQPSEIQSGSQLTEMGDPSNSGLDFCKRKFKETFKYNAEKYLIKNLKPQKHIRF